MESILARHMVGRAMFVAPPLILVFGLLDGWSGVWSGLVGVGIVIANFLLSGAILSISARIGLHAYNAAALIGFFLRIGIFVALVLVISTTVGVDRIAFGITAVVTYMALLILEAVAVAKGKERELSWTS